MQNPADKPVVNWLLCGCVMIFVMTLLGGITRLTGSGLSIVEWKVIMGPLPPLSHDDWNKAFDQYKQFPQYEKLNPGLTLAGFKNIFWWEYIHRLWGRIMGLVFVIPFIYLLAKRRIMPTLSGKLIFIFLLGALQGGVGWIMV